MRSLLWKDYRQNLTLFVALGVFLLVPYVIVTVVGVAAGLYERGNPDVSDESWVYLFAVAGLWSIILVVPGCAFAAANAVAGERADRSAEFAGYLPIPRRAAIASKAIVAIGACVFFVLVDLAVAYVANSLRPDVSAAYRDLLNAIVILMFAGATAILIFGVAWLLSTLFSSPSIAGALGLLSMIVVVGALACIDMIAGQGGSEPEITRRFYVTTCLVLGIGCFVAGVVHYVRGVEA